MTDYPQRKRIVEAALLAAAEPLTVAQLGALFDEPDLPARDEIARLLADLAADCDGRGVELVEVASGFRYQVRRDIHPWVSRLWNERQTRYSRALLETLALIAYRQPITRGEIEQVRGVSIAASIVRTLEEREWVRVVGYRDVPGKPALLGTTKAFLDYFGLRSLDELPALDEVRDLEDFDPQLALPDAAVAAAVAATGEGPAGDDSLPDDSPTDAPAATPDPAEADGEGAPETTA
jgi:segregation and condensation protein B